MNSKTGDENACNDRHRRELERTISFGPITEEETDTLAVVCPPNAFRDRGCYVQGY